MSIKGNAYLEAAAEADRLAAERDALLGKLQRAQEALRLIANADERPWSLEEVRATRSIARGAAARADLRPEETNA